MTIARSIFIVIYTGLLIALLNVFDAAGALGLGQIVMWILALPAALLIAKWF